MLQLGQGRTLILIPDATVPYVSLDLMMPGGNALLKPDQQGLADLTARALTDGSGKLDAQGVERYFSGTRGRCFRHSGLANLRHIAYRSFALQCRLFQRTRRDIGQAAL